MEKDKIHVIIAAAATLTSMLLTVALICVRMF